MKSEPRIGQNAGGTPGGRSSVRRCRRLPPARPPMRVHQERAPDDREEHQPGGDHQAGDERPQQDREADDAESDEEPVSPPRRQPVVDREAGDADDRESQEQRRFDPIEVEDRKQPEQLAEKHEEPPTGPRARGVGRRDPRASGSQSWRIALDPPIGKR